MDRNSDNGGFPKGWMANQRAKGADQPRQASGGLSAYVDERHGPAKPPTNRVTPESKPSEQGADSGYSPWGQETPQINDAIEVRWRNGNWKILHRPFIVGIEGSGDRHVSLLCTSCSIVINGRHLGELRRLLKAHKVDYLEEFNPNRWPTPKEGEPFIEEITELGLGSGE